MKIGEVDRIPLGRARSSRWADQQSVFWYRLVHLVFSALLRFWVRRFHAVHPENVPDRGGAFLIANHTSGMDPFVIGIPVRWRMLRGPGKEELFASPVFGYLMKKIGMFPLRQSVADAAAVRTMVEIFRSGKVVVVYPEGARSDSGELMPFSPDFARLMIRMKALIAPAGIAGARDLLPIGSRIPRRNTAVVVVYGEPFELSQFYGGKVTPEMADQASSLMHDKVAELVAEARRRRDELLVSPERDEAKSASNLLS
jgi:1-acyl-sn-glycerol-3-phosphate acyltransferase